jgi:hypothetical protein
MDTIIHTTRARIVGEEPPIRKALIEGSSEPVYYGIQGDLKAFFNIETKRDYPSTLDHIVAATAG